MRVNSQTDIASEIQTCRYCFKEMNQGSRRSPCNCQYPIKYAHESCLIALIHYQWGNGSQALCELCQQPFEYEEDFKRSVDCDNQHLCLQGLKAVSVAVFIGTIIGLVVSLCRQFDAQKFMSWVVLAIILLLLGLSTIICLSIWKEVRFKRQRRVKSVKSITLVS